MNMTDEQKRIRIAEACGWKNVSFDVVPWKHQYDKQLAGDSPNNTVSRTLVPDYLSDLNAMHEAEKTLRLSQRQAFVKHLRDIVMCQHTDDMVNPDTDLVCDIYFYGATARQRADAFLLSLP